MANPSAADLVGDPPMLEGLLCEQFLCQAFIYRGEMVDPTQVMHMRFAGNWWRLYFDFGIIFWRPSESPSSWAIEEEGWIYPLNDIGVSLGLIGKRLRRYTMEVSGPVADVKFVFEDGPTIVFENRDDRTTLRVIGPD